MKSFCTLLAAILCMGALAGAVHAAGAPLLLERDQALYYREADEFLSLDAIPDGGGWTLFDPLYDDGGAYVIQLKAPYGSDSVSTEVTEGRVSVDVQRLRPENEPLRVKYAYHALTLTPPVRSDTDADEEFSIRVRCGEKSFTLSGTVKKSEELAVFSGVRYSAGSGILFRFDGEIDEEPALVSCAPGLTLSFLGDYGDGVANLRADRSVITDAAEQLGDETPSCYTFTEQPVFDSPVTVRLRAAQDAVLYEYRNGRLYRLDTVYEDLYHSFETSKLTAYVVAD